MEAWVQSILAWVEANPTWALLLVFLSSLTESLFLFGLLIPGALLMFAAGAIVSTGALELGPTLVAAISAAILGDGLSYWLGRSMRDRLRGFWPISRYPKLLDKGESFFNKHGGKGIILGRFVGAVRPIIPTVAGASGMKPAHFFFVDTLSALGWAPVYILPGVVFGASLGLAAEVAGRMVVVLLGAAFAIWFVVWSTQHIYQWISQHAEELTLALLDWSHRHRRLGRLGSSLADPDQPETPGLAIIALILLATGWLTLSLLWGDSNEPPLLDALIYQQLQTLRTHGIDVIAVGLAQLGRWEVYLPLILAVLAGLISLDRVRAAAHWIAAIGFAAIVALGINLLIDAPPPVDFYAGGPNNIYYGGHIIMATVVYGFIPVLINTRLESRRRWFHYGFFYSLITLIAMAQLYLGAQWFSDTLLGISLGAIWVALLTLGYRRRTPQQIPATPLVIIVISAMSAAAVIQWNVSLQDDLQIYQEELHNQSMTQKLWRDGGYLKPPARVIDLAGTRERPVNIQWAGELDSIRDSLSTFGWEPPAPLSLGGSMLWLTDSPDISALPMPPQVHDGRAQALVVRKSIDNNSQWVIRLWPSRWTIETRSSNQVPLWLGSINLVTLEQDVPYLTFPTNAGQYFNAMQQLAPLSGKAYQRSSPGRGTLPEQGASDDWVLLITTTD